MYYFFTVCIFLSLILTTCRSGSAFSKNGNQLDDLTNIKGLKIGESGLKIFGKNSKNRKAFSNAKKRSYKINIRNIKFSKNSFIRGIFGYLPTFFTIITLCFLLVWIFLRKELLYYYLSLVGLFFSTATQVILIYMVNTTLLPYPKVLTNMIKNHDLFNQITLYTMGLALITGVVGVYWLREGNTQTGQTRERRIHNIGLGYLTLIILAFIGLLVVNLYEIRIVQLYKISFHGKF